MAGKAIPRAELERRLAAVASAGGNVTGGAELAGIPRTTMQATIREWMRSGEPMPARAQAYGLAGHAGRIDLEIDDGVVLVGSDAHIWPGEPTPAMRAFQFAVSMRAKDGSLKAVILNGDMFDGATISRFPSIGWEARPTVADELGACQARCGAVRRAAGDVERIWNLGNHDLRFEMRIANGLPEFVGVQGVHLKDHFPDWRPAWSTWVNDSVVIKHRFKGGVHAAWNNTKESGKTIVTGHTHRLIATPLTDYNGTRWGIEDGTLADPYAKQFIHYTEGNPLNWRSGFVELTFYNGTLLTPDLWLIRDAHHWEYRGRVYEG
jgi:hypothetical protein